MSNKPFKVQDGIEFSDGTTLTSAGLVDDLNTWIRFFGVSGLNSRFSLSTKFDNDGNIVFLGMETQGQAASSFPVLSKMDDRGNLIWQKDLNNELSGLYIPYGLTIDSNNNIFISVSTILLDKSWIIKFNSSGTILWEKEIQVDSVAQGINIVALEATHENDVIASGCQKQDRVEELYTDRIASKSTSAGTLKIAKSTNTVLTYLVQSNRWTRILLLGTGASTHPLVTVTSALADSVDIIFEYDAGDGQSISSGEHFTVYVIGYDVDFTILKCDGTTGNLIWHNSFGKALIDESSLGMSLSRQEVDGTVMDIFNVTGSLSEDSSVSGFPRMSIYSFDSDGNPLVTIADPYSNLTIEVAANTGTIYDSAFDNSGNLYAIGSIFEGSPGNKSGLFLMKLSSAGILEWSKAFLNTADYDITGYSLTVHNDVIYALGIDLPRDGGNITTSIFSFSASTGNLIDSSTVQKGNTFSFDLTNYTNGYRHGSLIDYKNGYINYCMSIYDGNTFKFAVGSVNASLPEVHIADWLIDNKYEYSNSNLTLNLIDETFNQGGNTFVVNAGTVAADATEFVEENSNIFSTLLNTRTVIAYTGDITFNGVSIIGSGSAGQYEQGTIELVPDIDYYQITGNGYGTGGGQYLIIDPTIPNHIHIRAGGPIDEAPAQLIIGGEKANITVRDQDDSYNPKHYVAINTHDNSTNEYRWTFGNDGNLTMPTLGNIVDSSGRSFLFHHTEDTTSSTETLVMTTNSTTYLVNSVDAESYLTLPAIGSLEPGWEITIADNGANAASYNITVYADASDVFIGYGANPLIIDRNNGLVRLQVTNYGWLILYTK